MAKKKANRHAKKTVQRLTPAQQAAIKDGRVPLADMKLPRKVKFREFLKMAFTRINDAQIGAASASLAYYALLSLFPMLITVGNLLPVFGLSYENISGYLTQVVPSDIMKWIDPIISNLLNSTSGGILSIGAVATLWAAGLGISGLKNAMNRAYGVTSSSNYLIQRLLAMVSMFVLIFLLGSVMIAFAFGRQFLEWLGPIVGLSDAWLNTFNALRWPVTVAALLIVILFIDYFLPNVRVKFRTILPGTAFTSVGWLLLAQAFSWYMKQFGTRYNSYGTIGTLIVLLLWLNFSAMMLLIGVVLNAVIAEYFTGELHRSRGKVHDFVRKRATHFRTQRDARAAEHEVEETRSLNE